ncbi:MAG: sensor histidine kinase [Acidimicrobiales bacterium]
MRASPRTRLDTTEPRSAKEPGGPYPFESDTTSLPAASERRGPAYHRRHYRRHLGLRARLITTFALGAFALSGTLASITYFSVRGSVLAQEESSLRHEAIASAVSVSSKLEHPLPDYPAALASADTTRNAQSLLFHRGQWYVSSLRLLPADLPSKLTSMVVRARQPAEQIVTLSGTPRMIIGIPMENNSASYFQVFDLSEVSRTFRTLLAALVLAAVVTTLGGAVLGSWAASRALRPLRDAAKAALAIAGGRLDTRLESEIYGDISVLTSAFNRMADGLQARIEREIRFTADVNHELRSPLTTLATSLSVLEARRDELPERSRRALDLLSAEVRRFRHLVDDLLEISRIDAGLGEVREDEVSLGALVERTAEAAGSPVLIDIDPAVADQRVLVDKVRFERIIINLLDNARYYAGGATRLAVEPDSGGYRFAIEDRGPGIPQSEHERIFDRFSRGSSAKRRGSGEGSGLGLAIVSEHARLLGGRVWVEPNEQRGARFVVELPLATASTDGEAP